MADDVIAELSSDVGTALRRLQRAAFIAVIGSGLVVWNRHAPLVAVVALQVVMIRAAVMWSIVERDRLRRPGFWLLPAAVALISIGAVLDWQAGAFSQNRPSWFQLAVFVATVPWVRTLRAVAAWSGEPDLTRRAAGAVRMARWVVPIVPVLIVTQIAMLHATPNRELRAVAGIVGVFAVVLEIRLWWLTRRIWKTLPRDPSIFTGSAEWPL